MFPTFIGILDIQSWWEVPSIAHFCSLFRAAFNLLDFDIEDLEEALLTDGGTEGRLLQELIVKLLEGCLPNDTRNDISTFNYQMFLRRLFRKKCQEYKCENPFNTDVDFELLPLRQKVEILRALCDFRLDAEDVEQSLSNLDSDSLRVEPLGHDRKNSAYWYFYGTRLYREDYIDTNSASHKQKSKPKDKKRKKRRSRVAKEEEEEKEEASLIDFGNKERESVWQVVCFTQQDWSRLVEKFRDSEYDTERKLYRTLSEDFMPEIPKLFDLKEKQQRRKLLQRNSSRVLRSQEPTTQMEADMVRSKIKTKTNNKGTKKGTQQGSKSTYIKEDITPPLPTPPIQKKGRQTNNSLASAVGQIVIHTRDEVEDLEKKKGVGNQSDGNYVSSNYGYKYGYSFRIEEEERCVGMHKVLESIKDHVDAWPFIDPVDEEYAPRYYSVVRKPMDLSTMEEKLEGGSYKSLSQFKHDFRLIVDNCRQYNGSDNEYTEMAINLKEAFDKAVSRYLESETSSDEDPTSPPSLAETPTSPSYPSRHLSSSHHNTRKRSKKSTKKSKSYKPESTRERTKSKNNEKVDEDEKRSKNIKVAKKKRGKKKGKKVREEELEEEDEEEQEDQESEDAISGTSIVASKRRKNVDVNNLLKTKKLPKESEELKKTSNKKGSKERHQSKKDSEIVRSAKETKENKKRKEDFEEDYESPVKSKSRKIEKKELEETGILTDNAKKSKLKKIEIEESEAVFEEDKKQSIHVKTKKNRKKEKTNSKTATKADEKSDKIHTKQKDKKSKQRKNEELKNGELKRQTDPKDVGLESTLDSKHTHISKKLSTLIGNKDVDSLDSLKDKISDRRREEKLKNEKEKQRKTVKSNTYSVKVPSISNTYHDYDKDSAKRSKSKKGTKEDKIVDADTIKKESEVSENKKVAKHTKGMEENSTIQALNQATEKTLHDMNKWLDDAPKICGFSSGSDSPVLHIPPVESTRSGSKAETATRKRPSSIKIFGPHGPSRPKKIQRTIDRLQPGKSKGNLLLKKPLNLPSANDKDTAAYATNDNDQSSKDLDEEPKLSLGTVLKNVDSIHLICKSLVSSPNLSNDDEEEDHAVTPSNVKEEKTGVKSTKTSSATEDKETSQAKNTEEAQKPKSATPNLSAWFKAFGAPKSKKKDEEVEEAAPMKKEGDLQEVFCGRQRRLSTGGSSVSESVSSFSQESPPTIPRAARSPQCQPTMTPTEPIRGAGFYQDALSTGSSPYNSPYYATPPRYSAQLPPTPSPQNPHPLSPAYPSSYEQQSPVYPQVHGQPPYQSPYQKTSPQENPSEAYSQMSPQRFPQQLPANNQNQSPVYPQHSPQPMQPVYPQPSSRTPPSNYSQPSPQQPPTPNYSQPSPQPNVAANYSQPSPQAVTTNYPQASPQQHSPYAQSPQTPPTYSQPSPQQQHSPYPQSSPQQPAGYGRMSPQPPPANYSQPSPQPPNAYSQPSPQPPSFSPQPSPQARSANYSQPSPSQPLNSSYPTPPQLDRIDRSYTQSSHQQQQMQTFPQHASPQTQTSPFSEPSPQNSPYPQTSPQSLTNYSHQSSPQQPPPTYSHPLHSPQTPPNYSQLSPQQAPGTAANYSQPSPQQSRSYPQSSPQRKSACNPSATPSQPSPSYSQPSPQQTANYSQLQPKGSDEYPATTPPAPPVNYPQDFKQNPTYVQQSPTISSSVNEADHRTEYLKSNVTEKPATGDQQRNFQSESSLNLNAANHQIYQPSGQYPPTYPNSFSNVELQRSVSRHGGSQQQTQQQQQQSSTPQESRPGFMEIQPRGGYLGKAAPSSNSGEHVHVPAPSPNQLRAFQENLTTAHESLYPSGFQPGYPLPPPNSRPVYPSPHYFDASSKSAGAGGASASPTGNPPPMKKRAYEPPVASSNSGDGASSRGLSQESATTRPGQEQFSSFDPMMALPPQSEVSVSVSQYDGTPTFVGGLADSMANPAYARLSLGLVGRTPPDRKEQHQQQQQQLLTIPRPSPATKPEHLAAYGRGTAAGELEQLNLLQSLAQKNSQGILAMSRGRAGEGEARAAPSAATMTPSTATAPSKTKRSRKSKHPQQQEQQNAAVVTAITTTAVDQQQQAAGIAAFPQYVAADRDSIGTLKTATAVPPTGSAFANFAASSSGATAVPPFAYDKDAAATFAFLTDDFRNSSYYNMALRQQQQQQQQQQQTQPSVVPPTVTNASGQPSACNKLGNQPPRNYPPPHPFLHSAAAAAAAAQRSYVTPVSAYVTPHGPNLMDPAYQQYIHTLYALQPPPPHHHRPSWL